MVPPTPPAQPVVLSTQPSPLPQLNWSPFKPQFVGKPNGDAKAHLLRTDDVTGIHAFQEGVKVQRFCITLVGEA